MGGRLSLLRGRQQRQDKQHEEALHSMKSLIAKLDNDISNFLPTLLIKIEHQGVPILIRQVSPTPLVTRCQFLPDLVCLLQQHPGLGEMLATSQLHKRFPQFPFPACSDRLETRTITDEIDDLHQQIAAKG